MKPRPVHFISHPAFMEPAFGKHHPLSIQRHATVVDLAIALGFLSRAELRIPALPERELLGRVHDVDYLAALARAAEAGVATATDRQRYNLGTMECPIFSGLWDRARATVGGSMLAARLALEGGIAFHPGGGTHHGQFDRASGFCYLNDPVFAIDTLLDGGLRRVMYVDLDAHHGDGVQNLLAGDTRVFFASIHEADRWPHTGAFADRVEGRARNLPVPAGINDTEFASLIDGVVRPFIAAVAPDGIVLTLGADALAGDPLSKMCLSNGALWRATETCIADVRHAVVLGGGGYNPWTTARLWAGFWGRVAGFALPARLPAAARAILEDLDCDLVDDEDRRPEWFAHLADAPNAGPIRPAIDEIIDKSRP